VSGIGEVVEPLAESQRRDEPLDITLVVPPLHVSTPAVYNAWDSLDAASQRGDVNDLEPAAIVVQPELARWRDRIKEVSGQSPVLAGSGATWFLRGKHDIADALPDATVIVTQSR
jgi:4-diphosphocytidyl-2-C-methyl-D-erythritol kinase